MKLMRIAAVCTAVAGVSFFSLAAASDGEGSANPTFSKEVAVLAKRGVSPARAARALKVQGEVARTGLVQEVTNAMGEQYAGAWLEPATAQIHFGVTAPAGRAAAQQAVSRAGLGNVVALTPVRSTWSALAAVQSEWDGRLSELSGGQGATTGLDAQRNAVVVTLSSSTPAPERAALEREAANARVNVFVHFVPSSRFEVGPAATCKFKKTLEAYCEKTLVSGVGIAPETAKPECSAGPMLIEGNATYMLTAGHCFALHFEEEGVVANKVTSAYPEAGEPAQKEIGKEGDWKYTAERDMAEVRVSAGSSFRAALPTPVPALLAEWGKKTETPQAVISDATSVLGETNCRVGMTSGEQCGTIGETNLTIEDSEKNKHKHLVKDTACGEGGDSGGAFFFSEGKTNNVRMQGILSLANKAKKCSEGGKETFYVPLKDEGAVGFGILSTFAGQALLTTANETRRKPQLLSIKTEGAVKGAIKGAAKGKITFEATGGRTLKCEGATSAGTETAGTKDPAKEAKGTKVTLTGCSESLGTKCTTAEKKAGEIVTASLATVIGYVVGSKEGEVGLEFAPESGTTFATFSCGVLKVELKGAVIAQLGAGEFKSKTKSLKLVLAKGEKAGTQKITEIEGGKNKPATLELNFGGKFEGANQQDEALLEFGEEAELYA